MSRQVKRSVETTKLYVNHGRKTNSLSVWSTKELDYKEWVECANRHPAQNAIWRFHELFARENYRRQAEHPVPYDLGGEG